MFVKGVETPERRAVRKPPYKAIKSTELKLTNVSGVWKAIIGSYCVIPTFEHVLCHHSVSIRAALPHVSHQP